MVFGDSWNSVLIELCDIGIEEYVEKLQNFFLIL